MKLELEPEYEMGLPRSHRVPRSCVADLCLGGIGVSFIEVYDGSWMVVESK